jgi:hypothetical protein
MGNDRSAAGGVQLGEDVIEEQHGWTSNSISDDAVHRQAEGQGERPLLAL